MTLFIEPARQVYPVTAYQLRQWFPDTSFPDYPSDETFIDYGCEIVAPVEPPAAEPGHAVIEGPPVSTGSSTWQQTWVQEPIPPVTIIPSFEFLSRFTRDEQVEMDSACSSDGVLGAGRTNLATSDQVDLEGDSVSNWLDGLVAARVISEERKAELLAPDVPGAAGRVWR